MYVKGGYGAQLGAGVAPEEGLGAGEPFMLGVLPQAGSAVVSWAELPLVLVVHLLV